MQVKLQTESLLRMRLTGIFTCSTAATFRLTSTAGLPIRGIALPQNCTETSILSRFAAVLCRKQQRIRTETLPDARFWKTAWFASETTGLTGKEAIRGVGIGHRL